MDITSPLFYFHTKVCFLGEGETEGQAKNTVWAVLQQRGRAYYHITQKGRRAVWHWLSRLTTLFFQALAHFLQERMWLTSFSRTSS
jgi:hypothetical protein